MSIKEIIDFDYIILKALEELNINYNLTNLDFINEFEAKQEIKKVIKNNIFITLSKADIITDYLIANNLIKIVRIKNNFLKNRIVFNFINTFFLMKINSKLKYK